MTSPGVAGPAPLPRTRAIAALPFAGTGLVYARVFGHPFILFDDTRHLPENPIVQ